MQVQPTPIQARRAGLFLFRTLAGAPSQGGHRNDEFGGVDWLGQVHLEPALKGLHSVFGTRIGGQRGRRYLAETGIVRLPDAPDQVKPIAVRHADVGNDDVWPLPLERCQRFLR